MKGNQGSAIGRLLLFGAFSTALLTAPYSVAAQGLKSQVESLKTVLIESKGKGILETPAVKDFLGYLEKLVELKSEIAALDASLSASGGFDHGRYNSGAIDVQANIDRTSYPHALRFKARSKFVFSPGNVQNEITSALVNYDYYVSKRIEVYGFIERFSDTFMSIKQRYESGVGVKLEFNVGPRGGINNKLSSVTRNHSERDNNGTWNVFDIQRLNEYSHLRKAFIDHIEKVETMKKSDQEAIYQVLRILDREHCQLQVAFVKKRTPFSWAAAFSVLSEVEQPELYSGTIDPTTGKEIIIPFDANQLFRLAIRPSFTWRLSEAVSLSSQFYWKPSLQRIPLFFKDSRLDVFSSMNFRVAKDFLWGGPASFSADYEYHHDWMPPELSTSVVNDYSTRGFVLKYVRGAKFHHNFAIRFDVFF